MYISLHCITLFFLSMFEDLCNEMFKSTKTANKKNKMYEGFWQEVLVLHVWVGREKSPLHFLSSKDCVKALDPRETVNRDIKKVTRCLPHGSSSNIFVN